MPPFDPQRQGVRGEVRQGRQPARPSQHYERGVQVTAEGLHPGGQDQVHSHGRQVQGRQRGDHHRSAPPARDGGQGRAPAPGHQGQRLCDEAIGFSCNSGRFTFHLKKRILTLSLQRSETLSHNQGRASLTTSMAAATPRRTASCALRT